MASRRRGPTPFWTDERIVEQLREIVEDLGRLPSMAELRGRGLGGMAKALGRKGIAFYAGRVGLPEAMGSPEASAPRSRPPAKKRRAPQKWSDEAIESELRKLVSDLGGRFPTRVDFESRGLHGLRRAVARKGGRAWAEKLGLELSPGQDRAPYGIEEARRDIGAVVAEVGRLPGPDTVRQLGHPRLATLIARSGGTARFCAVNRIELPA
jgi:hypothetical protein